MRLVAIGNKLELRLEDKVSGLLFAKCPVDEYPGLSIEPVLDSSRYFVVRLKNDSGQTAFIGSFFLSVLIYKSVVTTVFKFKSWKALNITALMLSWRHT